MKNMFKYIIALFITSLIFTSCSKYDQFDTFHDGKPVTLTTSVNAVAPLPADSSNVVLTLNWTSPEYDTDENNYKFVIEFGENGENFNPKVQTIVSASYKKEITARELNGILSSLGFLADELHKVDIRVISSYQNNNEQIISNLLTVDMTAYKSPSTVINATTMNVIGEAASGWDTDVALNLIGINSFSGVLNMTTEKEFKLRRDAGSWDINWGLAEGVSIEFGKPIQLKKDGANMKMPASTATQFQMLVNLNENTITIYEIPAVLSIIGNAAAGWDADVAMSDKGNGLYTLIYDLVADGEMKFRANNNWDLNWGAIDNSPIISGTEYQIKPSGENIKITTSGKYKITLNLAKNSFKIEESNFPQNLFLVGGGTPAGWDPPSSIPFKSNGDGLFEIYAPLTENGEFKFLEIQDWAGDWGDNKSTTGVLEQNDENNCKVVDAGFYKINADFISGTWQATKTNWGVIGNATPTGWDNDTDLVKVDNYIWEATMDLTAGEIKFRANDGWDINFGDNGNDGILEYGGANIAISEGGKYKITLDFNPNGYSYKILKI